MEQDRRRDYPFLPNPGAWASPLLYGGTTQGQLALERRVLIVELLAAAQTVRPGCQACAFVHPMSDDRRT